jgi:hypothetical protein
VTATRTDQRWLMVDERYYIGGDGPRLQAPHTRYRGGMNLKQIRPRWAGVVAAVWVRRTVDGRCMRKDVPWVCWANVNLNDTLGGRCCGAATLRRHRHQPGAVLISSPR